MLVSIGDRVVGHGQPALLVAEIGLNHDGSLATALEMVRVAAAAGADAVKVQAFSAASFCTDRATYKGERQIDLFKRHELGLTALSAIAEECQKLGVIFFGTPDSMEQAKVLVALGAPCIKVGSDDIVYIPLLRQIATFGLPVILSTGMASLGEIQHALEALKSSQVILLHCVSDYPTLPLRANMRRMASLSRHLVLPVGYSDHTDGIEAAVGAVWAGACIIEKHFTLDRTLAGPDHAFSADPPQWSEMVSQIRDVETMLGNGHIDPSEADAPMKVMARRSIVAARAIKAGDRFTPEALAFKRPGDGLPPFWAEFLVTRKAKRDIAADEQIKDGDWTCSC